MDDNWEGDDDYWEKERKRSEEWHRQERRRTFFGWLGCFGLLVLLFIITLILYEVSEHVGWVCEWFTPTANCPP